MNPPADHLLHGLAANPALPAALLDRLVALVVERSTRPGPGDEPSSGWLATELAYRPDLDPGRARALAALGEPLAVLLAYRGRLAPADVDPVRQPYAAVALLDAGFGEPSTARLLAAHPETAVRWKLASCPGLPADVEDSSPPTRTRGSRRSSRCGRAPAPPPDSPGIRTPRSATRPPATRRWGRPRSRH